MNYYWEDMKSDVQKFIQRCLSCQLKKLKRIKTKQPMQITDTPENAFDKVAMDIVGPLPRSKNGYKYILTMQDLLTKLVIAVPLKETSSETIAKAIVKRLICTYGAPKDILSDQGANLTSQIIKDLAKIFKIKRYRTTAFHPQSNGSLERSHHSLVEYLKQFSDREKENWDEWVELATFSYNTSIHEGTKYQPFHLVFGRPSRLPASNNEDDNSPRTYNDYLSELLTKIHDVQETAQDNLNLSKFKSKTRYDSKINPVKFFIGDHVFLTVGHKAGKLGDNFEGPYLITEIKPDGNLKLKMGKGSKIVHPNRVIPSHLPEEDSDSDSD